MNMYVSNLSFHTSEDDLKKFFSEYGTDIDLGKRRGIAALCIGGGERWRWWWSESIEGSLCPPFLGLPVIR